MTVNVLEKFSDRFTFVKSVLFLISCLLFILPNNNIAENVLPDIGGTVSKQVLQEEERIGRTWLKLYRQQVPTLLDPIVSFYVEELLEKLKPHSTIPYSQFYYVVSRNKTLNAFAIPGGVIGLNAGLFISAQTEQQFASVMAHELAHLQQRHYSRGQEKKKNQQLPTMAGLLAGIVLIANGQGDAGAAALRTTHALSIDQQLRFTREYEREADRIGMDIMAKANISPHGMTDMFEAMDKQNRLSSQVPEFLLTHPLTTNRMVDAINHARRYAQVETEESVDYQLVRAHVRWLMEKIPQEAVQRFRTELKGFTASETGSRYGLALALTQTRQFDEALSSLQPLLDRHPQHPILLILLSDIKAQQKEADQAFKIIEDALKKYPDDTRLLNQLSKLYSLERDYLKAIDILERLSTLHPQDPFYWFHLAETAGLGQRIELLHKARAEYFILHANYNNAEKQLTLLEKKATKKSELYNYATQRLEDLIVLRKEESQL